MFVPLNSSESKSQIEINLGDIVEGESHIYGDGVKIVARMEGLVEAVDICISESVYISVDSKFGLKVGLNNGRHLYRPYIV